MKINNVRDLLVEQLRDRYSAANQQASMYPKLADAAGHSELKDIISKDIDANKNHQQKLAEVFAQLGEDPEGEQCEGTLGLVNEANELLNYTDSSTIKDIGIAVSVQHINHHDIAGYKSCAIYAEAIDEKTLAVTLNEMLEDEKETDDSLNAWVVQTLKSGR